MARMRILTTNEQEAFDKPPLFDHRDRKRFFDLPKGLLDVANDLWLNLGDAHHQAALLGLKHQVQRLI